jgi:hypothetical protein
VKGIGAMDTYATGVRSLKYGNKVPFTYAHHSDCSRSVFAPHSDEELWALVNVQYKAERNVALKVEV